MDKIIKVSRVWSKHTMTDIKNQFMRNGTPLVKDSSGAYYLMRKKNGVIREVLRAVPGRASWLVRYDINLIRTAPTVEDTTVSNPVPA